MSAGGRARGPWGRRREPQPASERCRHCRRCCKQPPQMARAHRRRQDLTNSPAGGGEGAGGGAVGGLVPCSRPGSPSACPAPPPGPQAAAQPAQPPGAPCFMSQPLLSNGGCQNWLPPTSTRPSALLTSCVRSMAAIAECGGRGEGRCEEPPLPPPPARRVAGPPVALSHDSLCSLCSSAWQHWVAARAIIPELD